LYKIPAQTFILEENMATRALRGAITVDNNTREDILEGTTLLLKEIIERNNLKTDDMISVIFTATPDLNAVFPAVAARELGITNVSLLDMQELSVPGSLQKCIRILLHFNTDKKNNELKHVYLRGAAVLRPDLTE
jgi:chorismate mutase